ncbi:hypothetical protein [Pedobacter frigoris]|uniref:hypothetical protein n=1 Tax=Pedobacter frigoris TaxID=2571272 RepID=UPI002931A15D|nr:hypothetical protein [Pedobacter frigoris]
MKKLMMICMLVFATAAFAQAQQGGGNRGGTPEERAKRSVDQLNEKVKLTDDQKTKVTALYLEQGAKTAKIFEAMQDGGNRDSVRVMMTKANEATNVKISALLNDEQKKTFTAWQAERAEAMKKRMAERAAGQ